MQYQLQGEIVLRTNDDGSLTSIPPDPNNTDYAAYLEWVKEGNVAQPVPEVVQQVQIVQPTLQSIQAELTAIQAQITALGH